MFGPNRKSLMLERNPVAKTSVVTIRMKPIDTPSSAHGHCRSNIVTGRSRRGLLTVWLVGLVAVRVRREALRLERFHRIDPEHRPNRACGHARVIGVAGAEVALDGEPAAAGLQ